MWIQSSSSVVSCLRSCWRCGIAARQTRSDRRCLRPGETSSSWFWYRLLGVRSQTHPRSDATRLNRNRLADARDDLDGSGGKPALSQRSAQCRAMTSVVALRLLPG